MNTILEWITLPRVLCVIFGLLLGEVIRCAVSKWRTRHGKEPKASTFNAVVGVIVCLSAVWIMVAVAQGRNCALTGWRSVAESQRIDAIDNDSFQTALKESMPYAQLPEAERKKFTDPITARYLAKQNEVTELRKANVVNQQAAQRACGVK